MASDASTRFKTRRAEWIAKEADTSSYENTTSLRKGRLDIYPFSRRSLKDCLSESGICAPRVVLGRRRVANGRDDAL